MLIIPEKGRIGESLSLSGEYGLGFEYNDFYVGMDDDAAVDALIALFKQNKPERPCTMHGAFYDIAVGSVDAKIRAVSQERVRQSVDICRRLGARAAVFHTNTIPNLNLPAYCDAWVETNAQFYAEVLEANPDINVYVENMFDFAPDLLMRLAERLARYENFGVCLDFAHACLSPAPLELWAEALHPYIRHCHINDCDGRADLHLPLGRGVLDISGFFELLEKYRIDSTILLEIRGIEGQRESLKYLRALGLPEHSVRNG